MTTVTLEQMKDKVLNAVQHPHDGSVNGIRAKKNGIIEAVEYLYEHGYIRATPETR